MVDTVKLPCGRKVEKVILEEHEGWEVALDIPEYCRQECKFYSSCGRLGDWMNREYRDQDYPR